MRKILPISIFVLTFCIFSFGQNPNCPEIKITGPDSVVRAGETMTFTANVSGVDLNKIEYQWSVDKGTIIEGQGTSLINVSTQGLADRTVTAAIEIKGLASVCPNSESETGIVSIGCGYIPPAEEYGKLSKNDEKARLDALAVEITAIKDVIAYFIIYYPSKKGKKSYENRVARIRNHLIKERGIAPEKVVVIDGGDAAEERTRIYLAPSDATPPIP